MTRYYSGGHRPMIGRIRGIATTLALALALAAASQAGATNTYQDSFAGTYTRIQATSSPAGYTSTSGATYTVLPALASPINVGVSGGTPYSATAGSGAIAISSASLGLDEPAQATIVIGAAAPAQSANSFGLVLRSDSSGNCVVALAGSPSGVLTWSWRKYINSGSGTGATTLKTVAAGSGNTAPPAGTYVFTYAPSGVTHNLYWQRSSDGFYYNPTANAYQSAKVPVLSVSDGEIMHYGANPYTGGHPGIFTQIGQSDTNKWVVTQVQAGNPGIMLPPDVWITRPSDTFVQLYPLASEGGVAPVSYTIQRQPGAGGAWTNVLSGLTPGQSCYDYSVAAATAYNYRLQTVDSTGTTATGASISTTTLAPLTVTPYALSAGTTSQVTNGQQFTDTGSTSRLFRNATILWDERYQQYFLVCTNAIAVTQFLGFVSTDLVNWTYRGVLIDTSITSVNGALTNINDPGLCIGQDGNYYLYFVGSTNGNQGQGQVYFARSTEPMAIKGSAHQYTYYSNPGYVEGTDVLSDAKVWVDMDGTPYWYGETTGGVTMSTWIRALKTDFSGWATGSTATNIGTRVEGNAAHRWNRTLVLHSNVPGSNWGGGNPQAAFCPGPSLLLTNPFLWNQTTSLNTNVSSLPQFFSTRPTGLPTPAGADVNHYPIYPNANYSIPSQWATDGYPTTGIDPTYAYMSQCFAHLVTRTGQVIAIATRYDNSAGNGGSETTSYPVWLPISHNAAGAPVIPWVSTFVPSAQPAATPAALAAGG